MELGRHCTAARAARQFRRHRRHGNDDAQSQPRHSRHHDRADQETANRLSGARAAYAHRTDLRRRRPARRRAQGHYQQDRAARLCGELQRALDVRAVPEGISRRPSEILYLDWDRKITEFLPCIEIPLRPFPGVLGVARKEPGRYSSVPPGEYAGNLDIRDFTEGAALYVPVHVPGALLWSGDSHAGQGNGEVSLTAIETAYKELNLTLEVIKGKPLDFP